MLVVIAVHIYKEVLNDWETMSLQQLVKVTQNRYPIRIISPKGLHPKVAHILKGSDYKIEYFKGKYFDGLKGYNRLMTHPVFYTRLAQWKYVLIHHLDAFMFKDELKEWCGSGFANIGAPLYEYDGTANPVNFIGTGNGGFCLRHIESCLKVLRSMKVVYTWPAIYNNFLLYSWKGRISRGLYYIDMFSSLGSRSHYLFNRIRDNEDVFWGILVPQKFSWFKVPEKRIACQFSMEFNCEALFKENNNELPFGCHAWYKLFFIKFWKPVFQSIGINLPE